MKTSQTMRLVALSAVLATLAAAGLSSCSTKVSGTLVPNQPPSVELTNAPEYGPRPVSAGQLIP